ncbi:hypothetical protein [Streptomyces sp. NPDC058272]|uniref:hypothetical protein n=1 Tax=Streptomyces sp. NPDC058272 TaxID=3346415 RepID=UPI0036E2C59B
MVFVEAGFDERVEFGDLLVECPHAFGHAEDHGGRKALSRQCDVLRLGRLDGNLGERGGVLHLAVLQESNFHLQLAVASFEFLQARPLVHRQFRVGSRLLLLLVSIDPAA